MQPADVTWSCEALLSIILRVEEAVTEQDRGVARDPLGLTTRGYTLTYPFGLSNKPGPPQQ